MQQAMGRFVITARAEFSRPIGSYKDQSQVGQSFKISQSCISNQNDILKILPSNGIDSRSLERSYVSIINHHMDGKVSKWVTSGSLPAHLRLDSGITSGTKFNSEIESGYS